MYILLCSHRPPLQIFPSSVFSPFPSLWLLFSVCHSHPYTRTAGRVTVKNAGNRSTNRYNAQQIIFCCFDIPIKSLSHPGMPQQYRSNCSKAHSSVLTQRT